MIQRYVILAFANIYIIYIQISLENLTTKHIHYMIMFISAYLCQYSIIYFSFLIWIEIKSISFKKICTYCIMRLKFIIYWSVVFFLCEKFVHSRKFLSNLMNLYNHIFELYEHCPGFFNFHLFSHFFIGDIYDKH